MDLSQTSIEVPVELTGEDLKLDFFRDSCHLESADFIDGKLVISGDAASVRTANNLSSLHFRMVLKASQVIELIPVPPLLMDKFTSSELNEAVAQYPGVKVELISQDHSVNVKLNGPKSPVFDAKIAVNFFFASLTNIFITPSASSSTSQDNNGQGRRKPQQQGPKKRRVHRCFYCKTKHDSSYFRRHVLQFCTTARQQNIPEAERLDQLNSYYFYAKFNKHEGGDDSGTNNDSGTDLSNNACLEF